MSKNTVIGVVIVLIIIVGGILYFQNNKDQPADTTAPQTTDEGSSDINVSTITLKTVEVGYTDQGFNPSTVTINIGDTVKFVNQSSGRMWVASDPHPTHVDYPTFDEKTFISNGGSYEFTFDKIGVWGYHNHGNPSLKGVVIVK